MGQNFDDYSDFQKIPGMPILLQHSVCIKDSNYLLFERGLCLFKGNCLLLLPNVPGATRGYVFPDSRVPSQFVLSLNYQSIQLKI